MKKAVVISDSHGSMDNVRKIFSKEMDVDLVIHLGDIVNQDELLKEICQCDTVVVKGNCDYTTSNNLTEVIEFGDNKIFACHGHTYGVDFSLNNICYAAEQNGCNMALYGHTHVPDNTPFGGIIIMNPGSVSRPRQLNFKPTYAVILIDDNGKTTTEMKYV